MNIPRPEYPRPQFQRNPWINLNGVWTCAFDPGRSGLERGWKNHHGFDREILVPFCPESRLSGIGITDFIERMWYHRVIDIPADWSGKMIRLNFGAVDYDCEAFIDGQSVGRHYGGSASFTFDITGYVEPGSTHHLVLHVRDDVRSRAQPLGKQSAKFESYGCHYTRVTGIWQTVWLEAVDPRGLAGVHILPDLDGKRFVVIPRFFQESPKRTFRVILTTDGDAVSDVTLPAISGLPAILPINTPHPWSPDDPFLYDLTYHVHDAGGQTIDSVTGYAGLRKIHIERDCIFLNNEPLYQRLVLDQGYYPDGIWTASDDAALKRDIELAQAAGFNGARLHQKVFEERYHYWADRLGYLTWGESASWGLNLFNKGELSTTTLTRSGNPPLIAGAFNFLTEWREIIERDRNHPSIITWTPFNETRHAADWDLHRRLHREAYALTKSLDPTRPVNDASGYVHVHTDIWTVHNYEQNPDALKTALTPNPETGVWRNVPDKECDYSGQPYLLDEFGGIQWSPKARRDDSGAWGYGDAPENIEAFYARLEGQIRAVLDLKHIRGYCYTQLTDVEQEQNGIYRYDRSEKFDMTRIAALFRLEPPASS